MKKGLLFHYPIDLLCHKLGTTDLIFDVAPDGLTDGSSFWKASLTVEETQYVAPGATKKVARQNAAAVCLERKYGIDIASALVGPVDTAARSESNSASALVSPVGTRSESDSATCDSSCPISTTDCATATDDIVAEESRYADTSKCVISEACQRIRVDPENQTEYLDTMLDVADFRESIMHKNCISQRSRKIFETFLWNKYSNARLAEERTNARLRITDRKRFYEAR